MGAPDALVKRVKQLLRLCPGKQRAHPDTATGARLCGEHQPQRVDRSAPQKFFTTSPRSCRCGASARQLQLRLEENHTNGFTTGTAHRVKSATLRVATVSPNRFAVAAIMVSLSDTVKPRCRTS